MRSPSGPNRATVLQLAHAGALTLYTRSASIERVQAKADEGDEDQGPDSGTTRVIASTASVDRYGDIIMQDGWDLESFKANPVIMPFHDYSTPPVGRGTDIELVDHPSGGKALAMTIVWDTASELGATMARQFREGFMQGVSVGFRPLQYRERSELSEDHPAHGPRGFLIERAELLELSAAPVPVQQEALAAKALASSAKSWLDDVAAPADGSVLDTLREALRSDPQTRALVAGLIDAYRLSLPEPAPETMTGDDALAAYLTTAD